MVREDVNDLKHAYRVLDVPWDASPRAIKASYRRLVRRWHPDRYPRDSEAYNESTRMAKLINEAYGRIKNAPLLRAVAEASSRDEFRASPDSRDETNESGAARPYWLGFVIRFVCGAVLGVVPAFLVPIRDADPSFRHFAAVVTIFFCGVLSGFAGDAFWRSIRPRGWLRWGRWG